MLKNQIIYLDIRGLEAEKPGNLPGFQDLYIEIIISEAWRQKNQIIYMDFRGLEAEKPDNLLGFQI